MRALSITLGLVGLAACGQPDIATPIVGDYVGAMAGDIVDTDFTVTVAKVDNATVSIAGEGMTTVEFPLIEAAGLTTSAVDFTDGTLSADAEAGSLDFTWTTGQNLAFSGSAGGGDTSDTSDTSDTDDVSDSDDTSSGDGCDVVVPADATVVTGTTNTIEAGADVLICPGGVLNATADNLSVYVHGAGSVNITGANTDAWLDGAGSLNVTGANTTVYVTSAAGVTVVGSNTSQPSCASVHLDLSAVVGGC